MTWAGVSAAGLGTALAAVDRQSPAHLPVSGTAHADLEPLDSLLTSFAEAHRVPGMSLAVTRHGKLVYARGVGCADVERKEPVQPDSLFRIASVSKPITAVAIMKLVDNGKLALDDRVTERMDLAPFVAPDAKPDPRWSQITVRQCLQHTGGWDRKRSYDPIGKAWDIAKALGICPPITPVHIVRYMMGQPLDFSPGERDAYSNLGYLVLGRVIESVAGQSYESYVRQEVLKPLGITRARLGRALLENRAAGEVRYYDARQRTGPAIVPPRIGQQVPLPYGAENFEAFEAHGGWIESAVDLARFAAAFDDPAACPILSASAIAQMWARPDGRAGKEEDGRPRAAFYACGWLVRPVGPTGKANSWHAGAIAGSEALLVRRWDGLDWAVLFNTAHNSNGTSLVGQIDGQIHAAADKVKTWPDWDQFADFST
ncbi:MAG: beta-lactamase family protein [Planctomycetes bacterium]|nr:beta-lactamase family protein [Planctomycetota bacterium]